MQETLVRPAERSIIRREEAGCAGACEIGAQKTSGRDLRCTSQKEGAAPQTTSKEEEARRWQYGTGKKAAAETAHQRTEIRVVREAAGQVQRVWGESANLRFDIRPYQAARARGDERFEQSPVIVQLLQQGKGRWGHGRAARETEHQGKPARPSQVETCLLAGIGIGEGNGNDCTLTCPSPPPSPRGRGRVRWPERVCGDDERNSAFLCER